MRSTSRLAWITQPRNAELQSKCPVTLTQWEKCQVSTWQTFIPVSKQAWPQRCQAYNTCITKEAAAAFDECKNSAKDPPRSLISSWAWCIKFWFLSTHHLFVWKKKCISANKTVLGFCFVNRSSDLWPFCLVKNLSIRFIYQYQSWKKKHVVHPLQHWV